MPVLPEATDAATSATVGRQVSATSAAAADGGGHVAAGLRPPTAAATARERAAALLEGGQGGFAGGVWGGVRGWGQRRGAEPLSPAGGLLQYGPLIVHDMAVSVAEAVATAYLAEARQGFEGAIFLCAMNLIAMKWAGRGCILRGG